MRDPRANWPSRREFLRQVLSTGACLPLAGVLPAFADQPTPQLSPAPPLPPYTLTPEDDQFLYDLESANFLFFWEQASPKTGMVKDRCNVQTTDEGIVASIAATGFGLTALCIAEKRGFISRRTALERAFAALRSSAHPLKEGAWTAWKRLIFEYQGLRYIGSYAPLFVHQYSQAWFDFRGKRDKYADYFQNSVVASEVHRRFCVELGGQFPDYSDDLWGITASDSEKGYVVWGGPPAFGPIDGTAVPSASAGSLPFVPQASMRVLRSIRSRYGTAWCKYGFVNAFNPLKNWYDHDVIGIDTGITMLMAENLRTGFIWNTFMKTPEAQRGMQRAGFNKY